MTKILFLKATADLYGSETVFLQIIRLLSTLNQYELHIILPYKGKLFPLLKSFNNVKITIKRYAILRRKYLTPIGIVSYIITLLNSIIFLLFYIKKNNISHVYTNTSVVFPGALVSSILGIKHFWHLHEILEERGIVNGIFKFCINSFSTKIIAPSQHSIRSFISNPKMGKKYELIYNGIDINRYSPKKNIKNSILHKYSLPEGKIIIGMAGRLSPRKGHHLFIQAAASLSKENDKVLFIIAGDSFYKKNNYYVTLNQMVGNLNLEKQCRFLGFINNMHEFYSILDIFVLPSIRPECFPLTLLEAMAMKLPVVSTSLGGAQEIIDNNINGYLTPHTSPEDLAHRIQTLITNPQQRISICQAARDKIVEKFSESTFNTNMEKFYKRNC